MIAGRSIAVSVAAVMTLGISIIAGPPAGAATGCVTDLQAPDGAFAPKPLSEKRYGIAPPSEGTDQAFYIETEYGDVFVEVYLPVHRDGSRLDEPVPTILNLTPYQDAAFKGADTAQEATGAADAPYDDDHPSCFVPRGYAFAVAHVLGTGRSGGCLDFWGSREVEASLSVVDALTRRPWSDGNIGLIGGSYDAASAVATAIAQDPRARKIKALVLVGTPTSAYDYFTGMDGVGAPGVSIMNRVGYFANGNLPGDDLSSSFRARSYDCWTDWFGGIPSDETSQDFTPWLAERELRAGAPRLDAATLMVQGFQDISVMPLNPVGFFDRIPHSTPHKLVLGQWRHEIPRYDWYAMSLAWFDRYVKGLPTGTERWPDVQIEDSTFRAADPATGSPRVNGTWRVHRDWPRIDGDLGQLALGPGLALGATEPSGQQGPMQEPVPMTEDTRSPLTFDTGSLGGRMHVSGQPVLDLWVKLTEPDAHIVVRLTATGPNGAVIGRSWGARSARHLDAMRRGYFQQASPELPPTDVPLRVPVRLQPLDVVIPEGGRLLLEVGTLRVTPPVVFDSWVSNPSTSTGKITFLHDCAHPSSLLFRMPEARAPAISVAESDGTYRQPDTSGLSEIDGAGIASRDVCGRRAIDGQNLIEG